MCVLWGGGGGGGMKGEKRELLTTADAFSNVLLFSLFLCTLQWARPTADAKTKISSAEEPELSIVLSFTPK